MEQDKILGKLKMMGYIIKDMDENLTLASNNNSVKCFLNGKYCGEIDTSETSMIDIEKYGDVYNIIAGADFTSRRFTMHSQGLSKPRYAINKAGEILSLHDGSLYEDDESWCYIQKVVGGKVMYYNKVTNKKYNWAGSNIRNSAKFIKVTEEVIIANDEYINIETGTRIGLLHSRVYEEYIVVELVAGNGRGIVDRHTGELIHCNAIDSKVINDSVDSVVCLLALDNKVIQFDDIPIDGNTKDGLKSPITIKSGVKVDTLEQPLMQFGSLKNTLHHYGMGNTMILADIFGTNLTTQEMIEHNTK